MLSAHDAIRRTEIAKYDRAYQYDDYRMGRRRMENAVADLRALPDRGSLLDVGCGRGEMLAHAKQLGFDPVIGLEATTALCGHRIVEGRATDLPFADNAFDTVTLWDVIEHLPPGDDELVCREMQRVAQCHILLTANNKPSKSRAGDVLHINRRPYPEWHALFMQWFSGAVTWIKRPGCVSETWRIDL